MFAAGAVVGSMESSSVSNSTGMAKITADSTYYDRKEGFAYFSGHVAVDDQRYQLHADRAFVYMDGTNELKRIIALGSVALTNENRRAYGDKATYYRVPGLVVLYAGSNSLAEVISDAKEGQQKARGKKIKFWVDSEQVEVTGAELSSPVSGNADLRRQIR